MMADLNKLGLIPWFSEEMGAAVMALPGCRPSGPGPRLFHSHYFFASCTAHVSAMYAPFLIVPVVRHAATAGSLVLAFFSNPFAGTTTARAPAVFFGSASSA